MKPTVSRKDAKAQSAAAFLRFLFAPLRLCARNLPAKGWTAVFNLHMITPPKEHEVL
jgi:hypothetical protein